MENIETSLVIDVSFMTDLYWRKCDTNVCPVAGREGALEAAAAVHLFAWGREKKSALSKHICSNNFKIQFSPFMRLGSIYQQYTRIYTQFSVIISSFFFFHFIDVCSNGFRDWKRWNTYQAGWREKTSYIAAVFLQSARGLIVAEFSSRRLTPQVPPCDSWAQMDLNHHLQHWQHFASICYEVGRQCGTLSWPCGVGQGDRVLCPRLSRDLLCLCVFVLRGSGMMLITWELTLVKQWTEILERHKSSLMWQLELPD